MDSTYTKARLQYALKAFREAREVTKPTAPKIQRHLRNDYQLRRVNASSSLSHATTWQDDDASSDEYHPALLKRRRPAIPKIHKPKRSKQGLQPANPFHTLPDKIDSETGPSPSLVTLKLWSNRGRDHLTALADLHGTGYETRDSDEDNERGGGGRPRQPGKTFMEQLDEESGKMDEGTTRSGLRRKLNAPMTTEGCDARNQAKRTCPAKQTGIYPCKHCDSKYLKCAEHEISQDAIQVKNTRSNDEFVPNLPSSRAKLTQISPEIRERPIDELRRHFADVQVMRGGHTSLPGVSRQNPITLDSPSPPPEAAKLEPTGTFVLSTPWAHPIEFKSKAAQCQFCQDFRYGIFGYGLLKVDVAQMADGQLLEVANGHRSKERAVTRMCVMCALKRLYISRCKIHAIRQFISPEKARVKKYLQQLLDKQYLGGLAIKAGVYPACSLCAQPAFWRCVANQNYDNRRSRLSEEQGKGKGCGLLLCTSCAEQLQIDDGLLKKTTVQKDGGHNCRRADMEFLFAGSLLHKAYKR